MNRMVRKAIVTIITLFLLMTSTGNILLAKNIESLSTTQVENIQSEESSSDIQVIEEKSTEVTEQNTNKTEDSPDGEKELSVSDEDVEFKEKKAIILNDAEVDVSRSVSTTFLYSSSQCDTMNLYNTSSLSIHSYIDCYGYLMEYLGQNSNSNYYDVRYQGGIYAIKKENVAKFLTNNQIKSFPYYINEGGYTTHYIEKNPELSDSYIYISRLGKSPAWMKEGQKYYSFDGIYFVDSITKLGAYDNQTQAINKNTPYYDYYLYLPLRSKTKYTSNELSTAFDFFYSQSSYGNSKTVLKSRGADFIKAQEKYGTNALLVLSMAIHESAYGTSNFAIERNNLFGVGAIDSNPNQAAWFPSVGEGISEQGNFLSWAYADSDYEYGSIYYGSQLGNKSSGMNVKYASDPFWGEKIARSMALIDRYLNEKDYGVYNIGLARQGSQVFWGSNGQTLAHKYKESTSDRQFMYSIILDTDNQLSQMVMEPPYNSQKYVGTRYPSGGEYNWQYKGYINKNDYIKVVNTESTNAIIKDGNTYFYLDNNKNISYATKVSTTGVVTHKYLYYSGTKYGEHGKNIQYVFKLNSKGEVEYAEQRRKGTGAVFYKYLYYPGTLYENRGQNLQYVFKLNTKGEIEEGEQRRKGTGVVFYKYLYYKGTLYENRGKNLQYVFKLNSKGEIEEGEQRRKGTGVVFYKYSYYSGTLYKDRGKNLQYVFKLNNKGEVEEGEQRRKGTGVVFYKYLYYPGTLYRDRGKNLQYVFKLNSKGEIEYAEQRRRGTGYVFIKYFYYPNTKYGDNHGKKIRYTESF